MRGAVKRKPWSIRSLVERVGQHGAEGMTRDFGPFVLVGSGSASKEDSGTWSYSTKQFRPEEIEQEAAAQRAFDLDDTIVYPLRKRVSTFAAVILVGRATSNDVCIDDTTVSKLHARIRLSERGFIVEDAGSRNGTWVEGEKLKRPAEVCAGDAICFGSRAFRVYESERFCELLRKIPL
jgi:hypothetical protein